MDTWPLVHAERRDITDFLETLADGHWDAATLCSQ